MYNVGMLNFKNNCASKMKKNKTIVNNLGSNEPGLTNGTQTHSYVASARAKFLG